MPNQHKYPLSCISEDDNKISYTLNVSHLLLKTLKALFKYKNNAALCGAQFARAFIFQMSVFFFFFLSAVAFIGVTGLHVKTPKQLFIHSSLFFLPSSNYSTSMELQAVRYIPSVYFLHHLSRVFKAWGRFAEHLDGQMQQRVRAKKASDMRVCVAKKEGGRWCTQLKQHPTENLLHLLKRQVCQPFFFSSSPPFSPPAST